MIKLEYNDLTTPEFSTLVANQCKDGTWNAVIDGETHCFDDIAEFLQFLRDTGL